MYSAGEMNILTWYVLLKEDIFLARVIFNLLKAKYLFKPDYWPQICQVFYIRTMIVLRQGIPCKVIDRCYSLFK